MYLVNRLLHIFSVLYHTSVGIVLVIATIIQTLKWRFFLTPYYMWKLLRIEKAGLHRWRYNEKVEKLFKKAVQDRGYILEVHNVTTEDGYILAMHRIRKKDDSPEQKPVAFLQHGLKCSSADWHLGDLAYIMYEEGYDVWMGNFRGNKFSMGHVELERNSRKYWNFSWDEFGVHDLPAMLDFTLAKTNKTNLHFVGHSMGTTSLYVMLNLFPERHTQIARAVALAPVTKVHNMSGLPYWFVSSAHALAYLFETCGQHNLHFSKQTPGYVYVALVVAFVIGYHDVDLSKVPELLCFSPDCCSTATLKHYISCHWEKRFASRDNSNNYCLSKVHCPVEIYWSDDDWAAGKKDVEEIVLTLPKVSFQKQVKWSNFGHMDFLWSSHAKSEVYDSIIAEGRKLIEADKSNKAVYG